MVEQLVEELDGKQRRVRRNRQFIAQYLLDKSCARCGETNPVVLDFHHVRGVKRLGVSKMAAGEYSLKAIAEEIEKCEVVCSNCHRIIHHEERADWMDLMYYEIEHERL